VRFKTWSFSLIPKVYLIAAVLFFAGGQIIEFLASPYICRGTAYKIDGAFFQTLMSLVAVVFVFVFWRSITEDTWSEPSYRYGSSQSFANRQHINVSDIREKSQYRPIPIEKPVGMTVEDGVAELNRYKAEFLSQVETEVWNLIKHSQKRDVTAIIAGDEEYRCIPSYDSGYRKRFSAMMKHKGAGLPVYAGEELDSWLTPEITRRVEELYSQFFTKHSDIQGKVMLQKLRDNPTAYKRVGLQFAESLRESGEPLTEEMCKALMHLMSEQLSGHSMDQLGTHLGHALMHVGGVSVISTFATTLVHTMGHSIAQLAVKLATKITLKSVAKVGGKMIGKMVITGFVSTCASAAAAKGMGTVAVIIGHIAIPVIIGAIIAFEASQFTRNLADAIAPEVRKILAGDFENKNRSMLEMIGRDSLEDFAMQLGKTLALDNELAEGAKEAAKELAKAKIPALQSWV
jgi:hypothetical protein